MSTQRVWLWKLLWNDCFWTKPCRQVDKVVVHRKCFDGSYRVTPSVQSDGSCSADGCWDWMLARDNLAYATKLYRVQSEDKVIFICSTPYGERHGVAIAEFANSGSRSQIGDGSFYEFPLKNLKILPFREWHRLKDITSRIYRQGVCCLTKSEATSAWSLVTKHEIEEQRNQPQVFNEGYPNEVVVNQLYRDPELTAQAKKKYGLTCCVCGFDFKSLYGELGTDYIQVHHLKPIFAGESRNTVADVRCVCANCHVMIHRRPNDPISIKNLQHVIQLNAQ